jgi:DNA methylase
VSVVPLASGIGLPVLPARGAPVALRHLEELEHQVRDALPAIDDLELLEDWRARAAALETYLRARKLQAPMLGAQRRVEARIGELLGDRPGRGRAEMIQHAESFHGQIREEFRVLAEALNGHVDPPIKDAEWRKSRRQLLGLIRDRLPASNITSLPASDQLTLRIGDFREVLAEIDDDSVDLVFTDPPYDSASIPLYEDLAVEAERVLRPGGSLVAYCGHHALPKILPAMGRHLRYWWVLASRHGLGHHNSLAGKRIYVCWKPLVWFVKGHNGAPGFVHDTAERAVPDKSAHSHSQSVAEAELWIDQLCPLGGLVVDPFTGGGTTLLAARRQGRRAFGVEVDERQARRAATRLAR